MMKATTLRESSCDEQRMDKQALMACKTPQQVGCAWERKITFAMEMEHEQRKIIEGAHVIKKIFANSVNMYNTSRVQL
jgi:hypothetical protein